jgi:hypothetical protein
MSHFLLRTLYHLALLLQGVGHKNLPKFGIFGFKTNHLATLLQGVGHQNLPKFGNFGFKTKTSGTPASRCRTPKFTQIWYFWF